jgi:hypothetical protein
MSYLKLRHLFLEDGTLLVFGLNFALELIDFVVEFLHRRPEERVGLSFLLCN